MIIIKNYQIYPYKNDYTFNKKLTINNKINVYSEIINGFDYKTIYFNKLNNKLSNIITKELLIFMNQYKLNKNSHILIIGLGNENHTADSIGPKTLKYLNVNIIGDDYPKISALEPGVLGQTGIETFRIIKSVIKEINPDLVIFIDALVSDNINYLNKTIQINNYGLIQGSGIKGISSHLNKETIKKDIIIIGINTAVEIRFTNSDSNFIPYLLASKDIDDFIDIMAQIIGRAINNAINELM